MADPAGLPQPWRAALGPEANEAASAAIDRIAALARAGATIFPPRADWFRALELTPPDAVRVVILGQDPYHGAGQAHGLCFSVRPGTRTPPSLKNVYKEMQADLSIAPAPHGFLEHWARQGVLLLNTVLTVETGLAASHRGKGWEKFTDHVIRQVNAGPEPVVFMLWGNHAQKKAALIDDIAAGGRHLVLNAAHPSPLSAHSGFFGCRHFSRANAFLEAHGRPPIDWALPSFE